ncbi:ZIP zinc transporter-domain-containing protein [Aspergillus unguis]
MVAGMESPPINAGTIGMNHSWDAASPVPRKPEADVSRHMHQTALTQPGRLKSHDGQFLSVDKIKSWSLWLLSVLATAVLISATGLLPSNSTMAISLPPRPKYAKRQTCASGGVDGSEYNTSLHVGALFIILGVSFLACALPILVIRFSRLRIPPAFLFFVRHFGTGVLIATAFVHLLPTAFTLLGDPCLSDFWTSDYPAMPGAISLGGIFLVTLIEMVFSPVRQATRKVSKQDQEAARQSAADQPASYTVSQEEICHCCNGTLRPKGPLVGRVSSISRSIGRLGEESDRIQRISSAPEPSSLPQVREVKRFTDPQEGIQDEFQLSERQKYNKDVMQVFMLELGILFHSVFIGMSLSVSVGNEFVVLLIAIVFHQTFEGLALGSRIACLDWPAKAAQPWLMSLAYGCTTPIGQAIGIATHSLYSPDSEVGLLLVGTMNAISAGLLIFASLVELLSEDFLSDESWRILRGRSRVIACFLVFLGAFCMSLVGAWA